VHLDGIAPVADIGARLFPIAIDPTSFGPASCKSEREKHKDKRKCCPSAESAK
jgi:hypothetical protein